MNFRRDVTSVIQIGEEKARVEGYYHLDKTVVCDSDEIARGVVEKLDRLQKEGYTIDQDQSNDYGTFLVNKVGDFVIIMNKDAVLRDGAINSPAHEFLHRLLYNTFKGNPLVQQKVGLSLLKYLKKKILK